MIEAKEPARWAADDLKVLEGRATEAKKKAAEAKELTHLAVNNFKAFAEFHHKMVVAAKSFEKGFEVTLLTCTQRLTSTRSSLVVVPRPNNPARRSSQTDEDNEE